MPQQNKSAGNARWRAWYERNKQTYSDRRKAERVDHPERWRTNSLRNRYGLTAKQFDDMVQAQGGRCAICRAEPDGRLHVDHCHDTKVVRGLLCGFCNRMLGMAKDSPEVLRRAADYLAQHNIVGVYFGDPQ